MQQRNQRDEPADDDSDGDTPSSASTVSLNKETLMNLVREEMQKIAQGKNPSPGVPNWAYKFSFCRKHRFQKIP